jgi:hypothetical protein
VTETTGEIQTHIRETREDLNANLNELGQKVKSSTDWRHHYEKSPFLFLAAALGGGLLVAHATKGRRYCAPVPQPIAHPEAPASAAKEGGQLGASVGVIKDALIGLAATHAKRVLSDLLPGFAQQLDDKEKREEPPAEAARSQAPRNGGSASASSSES